MKLKLGDYKYNVKIEFGRYNNERTAIELIDKRNGEPVCMATTNIPEVALEADEVAINDYAENDGVLQFLIDNKIVSDPIRTVFAQYVSFPICKLLVEPK